MAEDGSGEEEEKKTDRWVAFSAIAMYSAGYVVEFLRALALVDDDGATQKKTT